MAMQKLKGVLTEKGKTYENCSKYIGISVNAFNSKINGKVSFTCWEATKLIQFLGLSPEEGASIFFDEKLA